MNKDVKGKTQWVLAAWLVGIVIVCSSVANAVGVAWTGTEDENWNNSNNWLTLATPFITIVPTAADEAVINNSAVPNLPVIVDGDAIEIQRLTVRVSGVLTMNGGSVNMTFASGRWRVGWRNGDNSFMIVNGGTITTIYTLQVCEDRGASGYLSISNATVSIGRGIALGATAQPLQTGGTATMILEAGTTFDCSSLAENAWSSEVRPNGTMIINGAQLNLNASMNVYTGGVIWVNSGTVRSSNLIIQGEGENGLVDIYEGMWRVSSNVVSTLETYVTENKLVGYGGGGSVIINFDEGTGTTIVTAVPEPVVWD